jgi:hypothetical protein
MIIESPKRSPTLLVHYDIFDETRDEVLFLNSPRLATYGHFTSRHDLPAYRPKAEGQGFTLINVQPASWVSKITENAVTKKKTEDHSEIQKFFS